MDTRFVIYRHPSGEYLCLLPDNQLATAADAEAALELAGEAEIALILPAETLLLTHVHLPPVRQASRRLQAARFALEDQLVAPVETQHFALGGTDSQGRTAVAVIDQDLLAEYLAEFGDRRDRITVITADVLLLPLGERDSWSVWLEADRALVRSGLSAGFACDSTVLPSMLAATGDERPQLDWFCSDTEQYEPLRQTLEQAEFVVRPQTPPAPLLACWSGKAQLNLAHGAFAGGRRQAAWWAPLKATAALFAVWTALVLGTQIIEYNRLQNQLETMRSDAEATFRETFPRVQTINDLRYQAEEELRALRGDAGVSGLFPLLQATAAGMGQETDLRIQSLQFRDERLSLNLQGKDLKALEKLRSNFNRQNSVSLAVENVDADNDGVQIRATLTEAGA